MDDHGLFFPLAVALLGEEYKIYANGRDGGQEFQTICPFCGKYRFSVNLSTGITKCWHASCPYHGKGGKFVWFVAKLKGISMQEANEFISNEVDVESALESAIENQKKFERSAKEQLFDEVFMLPEESTLITEGSEEYNEVYQWLTEVRRSKWSDKEARIILKRFPIYRSKERGFQDRAVFQISSLNRSAYLGYTMRPDARLKVLNPPDAVLSKMLFNYNNIKDSERTLYVCEGLLSAMRVIATGRNAVCTFGVALSITQALLLDHCKAKRVVFLYDNGAAKQASRNSEFMGRNFRGKVYGWHTISIDGKDPDDLGTIGCHRYLLNVEREGVALSGRGFKLDI